MTDISACYGPMISRLHLYGNEGRYELWEIKFLAYLWLDVLIKSRQRWWCVPPDLREINEKVFAKLIHILDDKSLSLIIRDAKDDCRQALKILREFYIGNTKPRIIDLYTELTSLVIDIGTIEGITDYIFAAATACTSLQSAGK